jgi:hypothetical protein
MIKFKALSIASFLGIFALSIGCNNSTNPPPTPLKTLQIIYPVGGENFKVGDSVRVKWKINDLTKISSVQVDLSIDSGKSFPINIGNGSIPPSITDTIWVPTAAEVSTKCIIKAKSYTDPTIYYDKSGVFTVSN